MDTVASYTACFKICLYIFQFINRLAVKGFKLMRVSNA